MYTKLVACVRVLLGAQLLINGLNWWVKLIDPYPSIADFAAKPPDPHMLGFMREMINTHLIFHLVKAVEVLGGVLLVTNTCVPFALVFGYSVAIIAFVVDVFLQNHLRARVMGSGILFNTTFLMVAYFGHYRSVLALKAHPDSGHAWGWAEPRTEESFAWLLMPRARNLMLALALVALIWGAIMVTWLGVLIARHFAQ